MATCKGTSVSAGRQDDGQHAETLSVFERRCLFKRVSELHELVRLADLGAHAARDRAEGEDLASICIALHEAELWIALAERLATRHLHCPRPQ